MQSPGTGFRISADRLRDASDHSKTLRQSMLQSGHAFMTQVSQTSLSNARNTLEQRLARWLLMARDRGDIDELKLTHEFLAIMLGVRRAGVTIALGLLEEQGLIRTWRGHVAILDRKSLEKLSAGAYVAPQDPAV
jgi:CRP-like cAMP-binding protein